MTVIAIIGALRSHPTRNPSGSPHAAQYRALRLHLRVATCCVALLTPEGQLTLANAGHLSPYRNGAELNLSSSLPLGLTHDVTYTSEHFNFDPGDHLTFVSDGVVESTDHSGKLFGFERTAGISGESAQQIAEAARSFGWGEQADDITVLTLDSTGAQAKCRTSRSR